MLFRAFDEFLVTPPGCLFQELSRTQSDDLLHSIRSFFGICDTHLSAFTLNKSSCTFENLFEGVKPGFLID